MTKNTPKGEELNWNNATRAQILHQYKIGLVRECMIYGKSLKETQKYFASKGLKISKKSWQNYRNELKSAKSAKDWFSKEAMYAMEEDHMLAVESARRIEDKIKNILSRLLNEDDFDTKVDYATKSDGQVIQRVTNYNTELLIRLSGEFRAMQETKTKLFSATPMVQEMLEVHRRRKEEDDLLNQFDTKKREKNVNA